MNADQIVFTTGASEKFRNGRDRRKSDRRLKIFGLARANYMCPPTDFFLDWRERSTCDRRPISIVPGTTESFCDWRGRSLTARQPHVFATQKTEAQKSADRSVFAHGATKSFYDWRDRCKNVRQPNFFCAWRGETFLQLAGMMQK